MTVFLDKNLEPAREIPARFKEAADQRYGGIPVLIAADRLLSAASAGGETGIGALLDRCRIAWTGTDGIRGKTLPPGEDKVGTDAFRALRKGLLSPTLVECAARAFGKQCIRGGIAREGDEVCVANDGRDAAALWRYDASMKRGFLAAGLRVLDLGILPTPLVPLCMLQKGIRLGAMLTASHNPSDQNGIKFFLDGRKLLPEGSFGDLALSALMYAEADSAAPGEQGESVRPEALRREDWSRRGSSFLSETLGPDRIASIRRLIGDTPLVLDTANGASHEFALQWFAREGIPVLCVNPNPTGANINRACGVARIERIEAFETAGETKASPAAAALFAGKGRFALVLDGDGDRGFLLRREAGHAPVEVLDGDREGLLILRDLEKRRPVGAQRGAAVFTVESDIMAAAAASRSGYPVDTVGVGDRWLGGYEGRSGEPALALGIESSGHVILPVPVSVPGTGKKGEIRSGFGLLTGLLALAALAEDPSSPYERGFSKTWYAWEVDKERFYRDSPLWRESLAAVENSLGAWKSEREAASGRECPVTVLREDKEDANVLFWSIRENGVPAGALFARNSGTEEKHAVYLKCRGDLASSLVPLAEALAARHAAALRRNA